MAVPALKNKGNLKDFFIDKATTIRWIKEGLKKSLDIWELEGLLEFIDDDLIFQNDKEVKAIREEIIEKLFI